MTFGTFMLIVCYMLPSCVAWRREHSNIGSIVIVNLFLGWTFFGWVIALAWAFSSGVKREAQSCN